MDRAIWIKALENLLPMACFGGHSRSNDLHTRGSNIRLGFLEDRYTAICNTNNTAGIKVLVAKMEVISASDSVIFPTSGRNRCSHLGGTQHREEPTGI